MSTFDSLVLDGGLLMEWLIVRYCQEGPQAWPSDFQLQVLKTTQYEEGFERLMKRHPGRLFVSAYAVAEVQRHVRDAERTPPGKRDLIGFRRRFWTSAASALSEFSIEERHLSWPSLDRELVEEFGPADASLVQLAEALVAEERRPCIVTVDQHLLIRCGEREALAKHAFDVIAEELA